MRTKIRKYKGINIETWKTIWKEETGKSNKQSRDRSLERVKVDAKISEIFMMHSAKNTPQILKNVWL